MNNPATGESTPAHLTPPIPADVIQIAFQRLSELSEENDDLRRRLLDAESRISDLEQNRAARPT